MKISRAKWNRLQKLIHNMDCERRERLLEWILARRVGLDRDTPLGIIKDRYADLGQDYQDRRIRLKFALHMPILADDFF